PEFRPPRAWQSWSSIRDWLASSAPPTWVSSFAVMSTNPNTQTARRRRHRFRGQHDYAQDYYRAKTRVWPWLGCADELRKFKIQKEDEQTRRSPIPRRNRLAR